MWKVIVAGTAALAIAGTSLVYAQQRSGRDGAQRWQPNAEDLRAFGEARLAALKAGLALTPEQEKSWAAFEQAARDYGKLRMDRMAAVRNTAPSSDPVERLRQRATAMSDTSAALNKLADATDPLYKSLDDSQKRRFAILNRVTGLDRPSFRRHDGDGMRPLLGSAPHRWRRDEYGALWRATPVVTIYEPSAGGRTPSPPTRSPTYGSRRVPTRRLSFFAGSRGLGQPRRRQRCRCAALPAGQPRIALLQDPARAAPRGIPGA